MTTPNVLIEMFDCTFLDSPIQFGDRVLVRDVGLVGPHRHSLPNCFQEHILTVFTVQKQSADSIPVFVFRCENGQARTSTLHKTILLPFNCIEV